MADFFCTPMGKRYYESTMPRIANALESIAESLKLIADAKSGEILEKEDGEES
jgi:hypothetical protein